MLRLVVTADDHESRSLATPLRTEGPVAEPRIWIVEYGVFES